MRHGYLVVPALLLVTATSAQAQLRATKTLTLEGAKNIAEAAEAEAKKNNWSMVVAIVDASGGLVLFHKADGTRPSNVEFALGKARTAARFQRASDIAAKGQQCRNNASDDAGDQRHDESVRDDPEVKRHVDVEELPGVGIAPRRH